MKIQGERVFWGSLEFRFRGGEIHRRSIPPKEGELDLRDFTWLVLIREQVPPMVLEHFKPPARNRAAVN